MHSTHTLYSGHLKGVAAGRIRLTTVSGFCHPLIWGLGGICISTARTKKPIKAMPQHALHCFRSKPVVEKTSPPNWTIRACMGIEKPQWTRSLQGFQQHATVIFCNLEASGSAQRNLGLYEALDFTLNMQTCKRSSPPTIPMNSLLLKIPSSTFASSLM